MAFSFKALRPPQLAVLSFRRGTLPRVKHLPVCSALPWMASGQQNAPAPFGSPLYLQTAVRAEVQQLFALGPNFERLALFTSALETNRDAAWHRIQSMTVPLRAAHWAR